MPVADDVPLGWTLPTLAALAALAVGPPLLAAGFGSSWIAIAAGAATWFVSVCVKRVAFVLLRPLWSRLGDAVIATIQGALSAILELGAAWLWFVAVPASDWIDAVGFGAGAGSCEVIYVLAMGSFAKSSDDDLADWMRGAKVSLCVRFMVPIERLSASLGHLGSRGVIWLLASDGVVAVPWAMAAFGLFAAIDGVAVYGHRRNWAWSRPDVCRRAHGSFLLLSIVEVGLFAAAMHALR